MSRGIGAFAPLIVPQQGAAFPPKGGPISSRLGLAVGEEVQVEAAIPRCTSLSIALGELPLPTPS